MTAVRTATDETAFTLQGKLLTEARIIFDVGGHLGQTSMRYAQLFPQAEIHYFEPQSKARQQAQEKLSDANVIINACALAASPGEAKFNINAFAATSSLQDTHPNAGDNWPAAALRRREEITVPVSTVDAYCRDHDIAAIDILKIDVQGHEYRVLQGAAEMLANNAIQLIYFEYIHCETYVAQTDLSQYFSLLDGFGYRLVSIFNLIQGEQGLNQCDILFQCDRR